MSKKRKVKISRIIIILVLLLLIIAGVIFIGFLIKNSKKEEPVFNIEDYHINQVDYSDAKKFELELNSKEYLLMRLNDFKVLYASDNDKRIYPASLTKVLTMDAILDIANPNDKTSYTQSQWNELVNENASLAGLRVNEEYKVKDVLLSLILPSGGDAAIALENYANSKGYNLVDKMNEKVLDLGLTNSHFTNPTGLHDDRLYTSLDDYARIVIDTLLKDEGKKVLKTMTYTQDDRVMHSSLFSLEQREDNVKVYGGKTGYTLEAGMNIMVLYEVNNRSYLLILANAEGSPYVEQKHIEDVNNILKFLYN